MDHNETVGNNTEGNAAATVIPTEGVEPSGEDGLNGEATPTTELPPNPESSTGSEENAAEDGKTENIIEGNQPETGSTANPTSNSELESGLHSSNPTPNPTATESVLPEPVKSEEPNNTSAQEEPGSSSNPSQAEESEKPQGTDTIEPGAAETNGPSGSVDPEETLEDPSKQEEQAGDAGNEGLQETTPKMSSEPTTTTTLRVLETASLTPSPSPTPTATEYEICSGAYGKIKLKTAPNANSSLVAIAKRKYTVQVKIVDDNEKEQLTRSLHKFDIMRVNEKEYSGELDSEEKKDLISLYDKIRQDIETEEDFMGYAIRMNLSSQNLRDGRYELWIVVNNGVEEKMKRERFRVENKKIRQGWD